MATPQIILPSDKPINVRAMLVGSRIDTKHFRLDETVAINPLTLAIPGGGAAVLFRYGVVVFFGMSADQESTFLERLLPLTSEPNIWPEDENLNLGIDPAAREAIDADGCLWLQDISSQRLQLVAEILARSQILSENEARVAKTFEKIEPLAKKLSEGHWGHKIKELLNYIGESLVSQQRMVGRAEVSDKPDLLWESPELEGLYLRLEDEFELRERHLAMERKLEVISHTAETLLDLVHTRRGLRVEWYVVILIVVEIGLILYELFFQGH